MDRIDSADRGGILSDRTFVGQRTHVSGSSMETTLSDGDHLIVDKISYRFREPQRYEIVVFPYRYEKNTYYIKRIIGLPGETVQIVDGYIYINGKQLDEHYGNEIIEEAGMAAEPVTLGEDEYFVVGDNIYDSHDSRDWHDSRMPSDDVGPITSDMIVGKVRFVFWPLSDIRTVE